MTIGLQGVMHGEGVDIPIKIGDDNWIACHITIDIMERICIGTAADLIPIGRNDCILAIGPKQSFTSAAREIRKTVKAIGT